MPHAAEMLRSAPRAPMLARDALARCIDACFDCAQDCDVCAEVCRICESRCREVQLLAAT
jgi:hypothetical protein